MKKLRINWKIVSNVTLCTAVISMAIYVAISISNSNIMNLAAAKALSDVYSGKAEAYDAEYQERLEILNNSEETDIVFKPFENRPYTLYVGDAGDDPASLRNQYMAMWYGKNSFYIDWRQYE